VIGFFIHALGGFGAGDAKMVMAVGAFVGPGGLLSVFVYGALFGGLLALGSSIRRGAILGLLVNTKNLVTYGITRGRAGHPARIDGGNGNSLPYGVPIAAGALLAWAFPLSFTVLSGLL
jgi:prepilin peptidase CpaA